MNLRKFVSIAISATFLWIHGPVPAQAVRGRTAQALKVNSGGPQLFQLSAQALSANGSMPLLSIALGNMQALSPRARQNLDSALAKTPEGLVVLKRTLEDTQVPKQNVLSQVIPRNGVIRDFKTINAILESMDPKQLDAWLRESWDGMLRGWVSLKKEATLGSSVEQDLPLADAPVPYFISKRNVPVKDFDRGTRREMNHITLAAAIQANGTLGIRLLDAPDLVPIGLKGLLHPSRDPPQVKEPPQVEKQAVQEKGTLAHRDGLFVSRLKFLWEKWKNFPITHPNDASLLKYSIGTSLGVAISAWLILPGDYTTVTSDKMGFFIWGLLVGIISGGFIHEIGHFVLAKLSGAGVRMGFFSGTGLIPLDHCPTGNDCLRRPPLQFFVSHCFSSDCKFYIAFLRTPA